MGLGGITSTWHFVNFVSFPFLEKYPTSPQTTHPPLSLFLFPSPKHPDETVRFKPTETSGRYNKQKTDYCCGYFSKW